MLGQANDYKSDVGLSELKVLELSNQCSVGFNVLKRSLVAKSEGGLRGQGGGNSLGIRHASMLKNIMYVLMLREKETQRRTMDFHTKDVMDISGIFDREASAKLMNEGGEGRCIVTGVQIWI